MENQIYRKRECELCKKFAFEKHLGTAKVLDGGFTRIENWEESEFGAIVVNAWHFPKKSENTSTRIDLNLCTSCKNRIWNAIEREVEKIKSECEVTDGKSIHSTTQKDDEKP